MTALRYAPACALLALAALLSACGGSGGGDDAAPAPVPEPAARSRGAATLDATGGTVEAAEGARLQVPPGALRNARTVTLARDSTGMPELPAGMAPASDVWQLTPHGATFEQPVTVRIPFDATRVPAGRKPVLLKGAPGGGWQLIEDVTVEGGHISARVSSFSYLLVGGAGSPGGWIMPPVNQPPVPTQPAFSITVTNTDFPSLPVTGFAATMRQQPNPAVGAELIYRLRVPSASDLADVCSYGGTRYPFYATVQKVPVAVYHLPGDGAGVNRLIGDFQPGNVGQVLTIDPTASTDEARTRVPLDTDVVVRETVSALDAQWSEGYATPPAYLYDWAAGLPARLPAGATVDAWGVMVKLVITCGGWGIAFPTSAPPVVIVRGFPNDALYIAGPPTLNAAFPGQQVEGTVSVVFAAGWQAASYGYEMRRPGTSTWLGVPRILTDTQPPGQTIWSSGATLRMVPSLADNGLELRVRVCADPASSGFGPGGSLLRNCSHSPVGTLTVANQFPQAQVLSPPAPAAWRAGDMLWLRGQFEAYPLPLNPATVVWQTRANAGQPWAGLPGAVNTNTRAWNGEPWSFGFRPAPGRTDRAETELVGYTPLAVADTGRQFRFVVNLPGQTLTSDTVTLQVTSGLAPPVFTTHPAATTVQAGSAATLAAAASGGTPMSYRWLLNGQPVPAANGLTLALPAVNSANAGDYVLEASNAEATVRSNPARLTVTSAPPAPVQPPTLATALTSLTVPAGSTASFGINASSGAPLAYQWRRNGTDIAGATAAVLSLPNVTPADAGAYSVQVRNAAGSVTSGEATLNVGPGAPLAAPQIVTQPLGLSVNAGQTAVFAVAATGGGPLTYQWQRDGNDIAGATGPVLALSNVQPADAGTYTVAVVNGEGRATSNAAGLVVLPTPGAPAIGTQPAAASAFVGGRARFTAAVSGNPAPLCLWLRNGIVIPGATTCSEYLTPVLTADDNGALYNVFAYSTGGHVFGNGALLTVSAAPPAVTVATALAGLPGTTGSADGSGSAARFNTPNYLAVAADGAIAIGDFGNSTLRIVIGTQVSTLAGSPGVFAFADGTGSAARFAGNGGLAFDRAGNLYVSDWDNHVIRRITPAGVVSTVAGSPGLVGSADGTGAQARFRNPNGLAIDAQDNLYVVDWGNHTLRKITPAGEVSTFAGTAGEAGAADGAGAAARFRTPGAVAIDGAGNLYVTDMFNHAVRKITPAGVVSTLAGTLGLSGTADGTGGAARFDVPAWISATADGTLFVVSAAGDTVRRISPTGVVETVVGVAGDSSVLRLGADPRLRNARGVWAVSARELLLNADQALIRIDLP